jgi:hypothetical protein
MRRQAACVAEAAAPAGPWAAGATGEPVTFELADRRSDGGVRRVDILEHEVLIERSIAGVKMRIALPFTLYEGVALDVGRTAAGGDRLTVRLVHDDPEFDVPLFEASDDRDITAVWQAWARRLGLPLMIADCEGGYVEPFPRLGSLAVSRPRPRRMPVHVAKRRPRFLTRRRTGRPAAKPVVHEGREIIARD